MALDSFVVVVTAITASAIFGAANSIFGWLKNNEPFDSRQFAVTVVTGIIAGVVLVLGNVSGLLQAQTNTDLLIQLGALALLIFGANFVRTAISEGIANRAKNA